MSTIFSLRHLSSLESRDEFPKRDSEGTTGSVVHCGGPGVGCEHQRIYTVDERRYRCAKLVIHARDPVDEC